MYLLNEIFIDPHTLKKVERVLHIEAFSHKPSKVQNTSNLFSLQDARPLYSGARSRSSKMKTRTLTSGSGPATNGSLPVSNGCNGVRKSRLTSVDHAFGPQSPRTRSGIKQEIDDEVSFV